MKNKNALHPWVRSLLVVVIVLCVPGLILASALGASVPTVVVLVIGAIVMWALNLSFGRELPEFKILERFIRQLPPA